MVLAEMIISAMASWFHRCYGRKEWGAWRTWASQGRLPGAGDICQVAIRRDSSLCVGQEGERWAQELLEFSMLVNTLRRRVMPIHSWTKGGGAGKVTVGALEQAARDGSSVKRPQCACCSRAGFQASQPGSFHSWLGLLCGLLIPDCSGPVLGCYRVALPGALGSDSLAQAQRPEGEGQSQRCVWREK